MSPPRSDIRAALSRMDGFQFKKLDSDGDVVFTTPQDFTMIVEAEDNDKQWLRVILPNFWSIDSHREHFYALDAAHDVTRRCHGIKIYLNSNEDDTMMAAELFLDDPDDWERVFRRSIKSIEKAVEMFRERMRSLMNF